MNNRSKLAFGFVLVAVVFPGCYSVPSLEVEGFLARQGFEAEVSNPSITSWEKQTFNLAKKEQWEAKSRTEAPNWKGAYYRFTIVKESYHSPQEASSRLDRLREKPPGLSPEADKAFPLREGFSLGSAVYIVSCQVSMFHEPMKEFTKEFERHLRQGSASHNARV